MQNGTADVMCNSALTRAVCQKSESIELDQIWLLRTAQVARFAQVACDRERESAIDSFSDTIRWSWTDRKRGVQLEQGKEAGRGASGRVTRISCIDASSPSQFGMPTGSVQLAPDLAGQRTIVRFESLHYDCNFSRRVGLNHLLCSWTS